MPLPSGREYIVPLLLELERLGGSARAEEIYDLVVGHFPPGYISQADLNLENDAGGLKYKKDIQGTAEKLKGRDPGTEELIELNPRTSGLWIITPTGKRVVRRLLEHTHRVDATQLEAVIRGRLRLCQLDRSWVPQDGRMVHRTRKGGPISR